jgi:hypothetical protein
MMSVMMAALLASRDHIILNAMSGEFVNPSPRKPKRAKPDHDLIPCNTADARLTKRQKRRLKNKD